MNDRRDHYCVHPWTIGLQSPPLRRGSHFPCAVPFRTLPKRMADFNDATIATRSLSSGLSMLVGGVGALSRSSLWRQNCQYKNSLGPPRESIPTRSNDGHCNCPRKGRIPFNDSALAKSVVLGFTPSAGSYRARICKCVWTSESDKHRSEDPHHHASKLLTAP